MRFLFSCEFWYICVCLTALWSCAVLGLDSNQTSSDFLPTYSSGACDVPIYFSSDGLLCNNKSRFFVKGIEYLPPIIGLNPFEQLPINAYHSTFRELHDRDLNWIQNAGANTVVLAWSGPYKSDLLGQIKQHGLKLIPIFPLQHYRLWDPATSWRTVTPAILADFEGFLSACCAEPSIILMWGVGIAYSAISPTGQNGDTMELLKNLQMLFARLRGIIGTDSDSARACSSNLRPLVATYFGNPEILNLLKIINQDSLPIDGWIMSMQSLSVGGTEKTLASINATTGKKGVIAEVSAYSLDSVDLSINETMQANDIAKLLGLCERYSVGQGGGVNSGCIVSEFADSWWRLDYGGALITDCTTSYGQQYVHSVCGWAPLIYSTVETRPFVSAQFTGLFSQENRIFTHCIMPRVAYSTLSEVWKRNTGIKTISGAGSVTRDCVFVRPRLQQNDLRLIIFYALLGLIVVSGGMFSVMRKKRIIDSAKLESIPVSNINNQSNIHEEEEEERAKEFQKYHMQLQEDRWGKMKADKDERAKSVLEGPNAWQTAPNHFFRVRPKWNQYNVAAVAISALGIASAILQAIGDFQSYLMYIVTGACIILSGLLYLLFVPWKVVLADSTTSQNNTTTPENNTMPSQNNTTTPENNTMPPVNNTSDNHVKNYLCLFSCMENLIHAPEYLTAAFNSLTDGGKKNPKDEEWRSSIENARRVMEKMNTAESGIDGVNFDDINDTALCGSDTPDKEITKTWQEFGGFGVSLDAIVLFRDVIIIHLWWFLESYILYVKTHSGVSLNWVSGVTVTPERVALWDAQSMLWLSSFRVLFTFYHQKNSKVHNTVIWMSAMQSLVFNAGLSLLMCWHFKTNSPAGFAIFLVLRGAVSWMGIPNLVYSLWGSRKTWILPGSGESTYCWGRSRKKIKRWLICIFFGLNLSFIQIIIGAWLIIPMTTSMSISTMCSGANEASSSATFHRIEAQCTHPSWDCSNQIFSCWSFVVCVWILIVLTLFSNTFLSFNIVVSVWGYIIGWSKSHSTAGIRAARRLINMKGEDKEAIVRIFGEAHGEKVWQELIQDLKRRNMLSTIDAERLQKFNDLHDLNSLQIEEAKEYLSFFLNSLHRFHDDTCSVEIKKKNISPTITQIIPSYDETLLFSPKYLLLSPIDGTTSMKYESNLQYISSCHPGEWSLFVKSLEQGNDLDSVRLLTQMNDNFLKGVMSPPAIRDSLLKFAQQKFDHLELEEITRKNVEEAAVDSKFGAQFRDIISKVPFNDIVNIPEFLVGVFANPDWRLKICCWASYRGQTVLRTVRGALMLHKAAYLREKWAESDRGKRHEECIQASKNLLEIANLIAKTARLQGRGDAASEDLEQQLQPPPAKDLQQVGYSNYSKSDDGAGVVPMQQQVQLQMGDDNGAGAMTQQLQLPLANDLDPRNMFDGEGLDYAEVFAADGTLPLLQAADLPSSVNNQNSQDSNLPQNINGDGADDNGQQYAAAAADSDSNQSKFGKILDNLQHGTANIGYFCRNPAMLQFLQNPNPRKPPKVEYICEYLEELRGTIGFPSAIATAIKVIGMTEDNTVIEASLKRLAAVVRAFSGTCQLLLALQQIDNRIKDGGEKEEEFNMFTKAIKELQEENYAVVNIVLDKLEKKDEKKSKLNLKQYYTAIGNEDPLEKSGCNFGTCLMNLGNTDGNASVHDWTIAYVIPRKFPLLLGKDANKTQGKAGNQTQCLRFAFGEVLQLMDANMDAKLGEAFKFPAVSKMIIRDPSHRGKRYRVVGFRENIFSSRDGVVGKCFANAEFAFGTIFQRILATLGVRMHYGHPDGMDADFAASRGGVSKASKSINLSEDIFFGFNVFVRGEKSGHTDFVEWEKGRESQLLAGINLYSKFAEGSIGVLRSRDYARIVSRLMLWQQLSFICGSVGMYITQIIIDASIYCYVFTMFFAFLAQISLAELGTLQSTLATEWVISAGSVTVIPLLAEMVLERGIAAGFIMFSKSMAFSTAIFTLVNKAISYFAATSILTGNAAYRNTGRPVGNTAYTMRQSYQLLVQSHYTPAIFLLYIYALYASLAQGSDVGFVRMFMIPVICSLWALSPALFCPNQEWVHIQKDIKDFAFFIMNAQLSYWNREEGYVSLYYYWLDKYIVANGGNVCQDCSKCEKVDAVICDSCFRQQSGPTATATNGNANDPCQECLELKKAAEDNKTIITSNMDLCSHTKLEFSGALFGGRLANALILCGASVLICFSVFSTATDVLVVFATYLMPVQFVLCVQRYFNSAGPQSAIIGIWVAAPIIFFAYFSIDANPFADLRRVSFWLGLLVTMFVLAAVRRVLLVVIHLILIAVQKIAHPSKHGLCNKSYLVAIKIVYELTMGYTFHIILAVIILVSQGSVRIALMILKILLVRITNEVPFLAQIFQ